MLGVINKSIQSFVCAHYGAQGWRDVVEGSGHGADGFEAMLPYEDAQTEALLRAAQAVTGNPREVLLEDIGGWLAMTEPLRRLLRFGGSDYLDFLFSLDDLQGRGQMALPDLDLPELTLQTEAQGCFTLVVRGRQPGWGALMAGLMRAMADDYGALVTIESVLAPAGRDSGSEAAGVERVQVVLHDGAFFTGRRFDLANREAGEAG